MQAAGSTDAPRKRCGEARATSRLRASLSVGAAVLLAVVALGACGLPGTATEGDIVGDAGSGGEPEESSDGRGDGAGGRNGRNGGGSAGGDGGDGGEEIAARWFLPPAGPESPSNNEDAAYRSLQDGDRGACRAALGDTGFFAADPPGGFVTGTRTFHLYRAGALLCVGDANGAGGAFEQALAGDWVPSTGAVNRERVCNVWDRVTLLLAAGGACELQGEPDDIDGGASGGSEAPEGGPAAPTEAAPPDGGSGAPTESATP